MKKIGKFFIAGTDTDAGKTLIAQALLHKAGEAGFKTLGLKPVAAGAEFIDGELKNDDAIKLQAASTVKISYAQTNPVIFTEAIAPHIAAEKNNRQITAARVEGFLRGAMMTPSELCLIEGAGGWLVPLNHRETLSAVVKRLDLPVILVVGMKLGCLNHALLTVESIKLNGLKVAGWVANQIDADMAVFDENIATLEKMLPAPCLGVVPFMPELDIAKVADCLSLPTVP
jgi:dethiobiotin synthetase